MIRTYKEYLRLRHDGMKMEEIITLARSDYGIKTGDEIPEADLYKGVDVPFNLEREYVNYFIDKKQYDKAEEVLQRMRCSYPDITRQNFIEGYEYHLKSIVKSEKAINDSIIEAKREFNQHTITLVSVIVGVITIFGSANTIFVEHTYDEMFRTFLTIVISIIAVIWIVTALNAGPSKKQAE